MKKDEDDNELERAMSDVENLTPDQRWGILLVAFKRLCWFGSTQKVLELLVALLKNVGSDPDRIVKVVSSYFDKELVVASFMEYERQENDITH